MKVNMLHKERRIKRRPKNNRNKYEKINTESFGGNEIFSDIFDLIYNLLFLSESMFISMFFLCENIFKKYVMIILKNYTKYKLILSK